VIGARAPHPGAPDKRPEQPADLDG
jgi:hypothetical protein